MAARLIGGQTIHSFFEFPHRTLLKDNDPEVNPKNKYQKLNNEKKIEQVKSINGSAMFFSVKVFKKIGGFDKNIWLFFEENDFCVRANRLNYNLYIINDAIAYHKGGESMDKKSNENEHNMLMVKYWHGQWSQYYFYKKNLIHVQYFAQKIF